MRYTLKDYQEDAVADVLDNLRKSARDWRQDRDTSAFSLTATTGSGKTVMAAAVIEALFAGNVDNDFAPDPGAVVLWFTDSPPLNQQTRFRLMAASERLGSSRLEIIKNGFRKEKLEPGKVYFLNSQKLSKNSWLVRGAPQTDAEDPQYALENMPSPDDRVHTLWDILRNTIEDENLTLYLILDEAHRGMMKPDRDRATTVQRLINGKDGTPPVPIVLGISATVERFDNAMKKRGERTLRSSVIVDPARVQESGLLKDDIRLDFPIEKGDFSTTLLTRATRKLKEATRLWQEYAEREGVEDDVVVPLMVVQVPNIPSNPLMQSYIEAIRDEWLELASDSMAHVFGQDGPLKPAGFTIHKIDPEVVQHRPHIRVLFAKEAISIGWDCPRAEVFVSFRPATDETHITQLIGRMVRTPLARRIPGNDVLNAVECLLPMFKRDTATRVARAMTGDRAKDDDGSGGGAGRRVLVAPVDMKANPAIADAVWHAFEALPSQTLPRKAARPIVRYTALAYALSRDGLRENASKEAYDELGRVLTAFSVRYPENFEAAKDDVQQMDGATLVVGVHGGEVIEAGSFAEIADDRAIEADYKAAGRKLTPELAKRYAEHIADDEDEDSLLDAHITVGALGKMEGVTETLDKEADALAVEWFAEYRVAIKGLSEERQAAYDAIKGMSPAPQRIDPKRPYVRTEDTKDLDGNLLETRSLHLMANEHGEFPIANLNKWEVEVLDREMGRADCLGWYRNPSRPSADAVAVAWRDGQDNWRRMCPDFVFFHGEEENVKVSIVDPHGIHLADALPKLRGMAAFADDYGSELHRIEAVAEIAGTLRVLDLKDTGVRAAVADAKDVETLYKGDAAADY